MIDIRSNTSEDSLLVSPVMYRIILLVFLLTICSAEHIEPHLSGPYAISSQSFNREDIPLSYKYTAIHIYTTQKPERMKHQNLMQYAPLHPSPDQLENNYRLTQELIPHNIQNFHVVPKKEYLEPKVENNFERRKIGRNQEKKLYAPGQNIEILQSVNRSPGHNAVYRSYSDKMVQKKNKTNFFHQFGILQNSAPQTEKSFPATETPESGSNSESQKYMKWLAKANMLYNVEDPLQRLQPESPYPKSSRLHLNVARGHHVAALRQNLNADKVPTHTQAIIGLPENVLSQKRQETVILYPVGKENLRHIQS